MNLLCNVIVAPYILFWRAADLLFPGWPHD